MVGRKGAVADAMLDVAVAAASIFIFIFISTDIFIFISISVSVVEETGSRGPCLW